MRFALFIMALMLGQQVKAEVLWRSGTGLDRWQDLQRASDDRIARVPSPVTGENRQVLRFTLKAGDVAYNRRHFPPVALGNRSEVVHLPPVSEGDVRWYRWRVLFPEGFSVSDPKGGGVVFAQWHHQSLTGEPGSPPLLLTADARWIRVVVVPELQSQEANTIGRVAQRPGRWRDIVLHVVFSSDPKKGQIEMWCDGDRVLAKHVATMFSGYDNYLKMGLYRRPTVPEDNVIYLDEVTEATSRADVWPVRAGR